MRNKNTIVMRTDPSLKELLDKIRTERFRCGKDKELKSPARITLAAARVLKMPNIEKILMEGRIDD